MNDYLSDQIEKKHGQSNWDPALVLQLLAIIGTVAFFLMIAYSLNNHPQTTPEIWGVFLAFATFVVTERIKQLADYLSAERSKNEMNQILKGIAHRIDNTSDVVHIGLTKDAVVIMQEAMEGGAISILDSFFRVRTNNSYEMKDIMVKNYILAMKKLLDRGGKYVCIGNSIGINSSLLARAVQNNLIIPKDYKNLIIKETDCNIPFTNYVIIEHDNGLEEVYFGWDYNDTFTGHVFLSRNPRVLNLFKTQFTTLDAIVDKYHEWPMSNNNK